jgi:hypothetical protein
MAILLSTYLLAVALIAMVVAIAAASERRQTFRR